MKRPLFVIGVTFALATRAAFVLSGGTALQLSVALFVTAVALELLVKRRGLSVALLAAALALGSYALYDLRSVKPFRAVEGATVEVSGLLLEKSGQGGSAGFTLLADFPGASSLPGGQRVVVRTSKELSWEPGEYVRCLIKAQFPGNTASADYYRSAGVALTGRLRGNVLQAPGERHRFQRVLLRVRQRMHQNLQRNLPQRSAQVLGAVVLGLQGEVPPNTYTAVSRSGTAHLLAVSGLHLSVLTAFVLGLLERLRVPDRPRFALAILAAFAFAGLVGFSASILRAFVMTAVALLGRCFSRKGDSRNSLGFALLLICLAAPYWTMGRGLWLSAGSTLGIVLFASRLSDRLLPAARRRGPPARGFLELMLGSLAVSVSAYVFSLPILLVASGWFSLISPVANMLIAPFLTPLLLGGIACAALAGGGALMGLLATATDFCCGMVLGVSEALSRLPFSTFAIDQGWHLLLLAGAAAGLVVLWRFAWDKKLMAYGLALLVICWGAGSLSQGWADRNMIELAAVDRCDTAVLIRNRQAVLLGTPNRYEINRLLRYLDFRGVTRISAVLAADCPEQIDSGLIRLRDAYPVDCVIGPDDAYILSQLEAALPGCQVYAGGYATVLLLDAAVAVPQRDSGVRVGGKKVLKIDEEYAIMVAGEDDVVRVYRSGVLIPPAGVHPLAEPVGRQLYGETRVLLHL